MSSNTQELLGNPLGFGIAAIAGILIAKEINQNSNKSIDDIISSLLLEQKKNITKPISTGRTSSFADEFFAELEKQGITKERIETLRNLDYTKMTKKDFARIKPEIEEIINLTKSYDLAKTNPEGYMVKFMPVDKINEYLHYNKNNITGFIAREEDVIQLQTFEDIFYSMRLDYTNNKFVYDNEIAFIKFKSSDYTETTVPIGKNYGGTEEYPQPFGGLGLLKTENGQIIREYKVTNKKDGLKLKEAVMYKIQKDGTVVEIAIYDNDIKNWVIK